MATNPVKRHFTYSSREFYQFYKYHRRAIGRPVGITYKNYKKLITEMWTILMKDVVEGGCFMMPHKMGMITVKKGNRKLKINKLESIKQGKRVRYTQQHTNGDIFRFSWIKSNYFANKQFYNFKFIYSIDYQDKHRIGGRGLRDYLLEISKDPTKQSYTRK